MNLHQSAFLKALGWSLMDSLWQMGVLWLLYVLLTANGKRFTSRQRHSLALLSLAGGSLWFVINLAVQFYEATGPLTVTIIDKSSESSFYFSKLIPGLENLLPFVSVGYLFMVAFLFVRLATQYRNIKKLHTRGLHKAKPELKMFMKDLAERIGIHKQIQLWLSDLVDTPLTIGFWKPIILLPVAAVNHLSIKQCEAIILHELNHIKRNDYLINLLIAFSEVVLFFNPFSRVLTRMVRIERENSCDDMVLQFRYDANQYANALLLLERNRFAQRSLSIAATGTAKQLLFRRVKRILTKEQVGCPINHRIWASFISFSLLGFIGWYNPGNVIIEKIEKQPVVQYASFSSTAPVSETLILRSLEEKPVRKLIRSEVTLQINREVKEEKMKHEVELLKHAIVQEQKKLAELDRQRTIKPAIQFVADKEARDYSIADPVMPVEAAAPAEVYPYVPSTSFSYQVVEDTAMPKQYIMTYSEKQAKEAMDKALAALNEVNWQELEKQLNLNGKKADVVKLQKELKKAIQQVDWKKINDQVGTSLNTAEDVLLQGNESLRAQLQQYQKLRIQKEQQLNQVRQQILQERLYQSNSDCPDASKPAVKKNKKTVYL
jgi:beta-lactamase regulating signal transducer with metallopeptidase domain